MGIHPEFAQMTSIPNFDALMGIDPTDPKNLEEFLNSQTDELFEDGKLKIALNIVARTEDLAFSDKVLNPELFEIEQEFRMQLPTDDEVSLEAMIEDLAELDDLD